MSLWVNKYKPKTTKDVIGQDAAVKQLKDFIADFKKKKKKAAIVYGHIGCGKTCAIYAAANEINAEILEVNASDFRNKEHVDSIIGSASKQMSLFAKTKVILFDEIDGLSGTGDRGAIPALVKLIETTHFPIILTCNDPHDSKFSALRRKTESIEFRELDHTEVYGVLESVCSAEKVKFDEAALKSLARRTGSDVRAALNDLQNLADENGRIEKKDVEELGERNQTKVITSAVLKILKTKDPAVARATIDEISEDADELILWLDENIPKEYEKPEELGKAYDALSRADVFRGRIRRWQHWRFLSYVNDLATAGVALSKKEKYGKQVEYTRAGRLLKIWIANSRYQKRKEIAKKIAAKTHCSSKVALQSMLPYLKPMFKTNKTASNELIAYLGLDAEEAEWMKKSH